PAPTQNEAQPASAPAAASSAPAPAPSMAPPAAGVSPQPVDSLANATEPASQVPATNVMGSAPAAPATSSGNPAAAPQPSPSQDVLGSLSPTDPVQVGAEESTPSATAAPADNAGGSADVNDLQTASTNSPTWPLRSQRPHHNHLLPLPRRLQTWQRQLRVANHPLRLSPQLQQLMRAHQLSRAPRPHLLD
ncbi:hypothetical protein LRY58_03930, partial [Candidatus Woesebacteria bacterium]|nr:hypothetical protein [Candidatus Woesebacteria bacterium]